MQQSGDWLDRTMAFARIPRHLHRPHHCVGADRNPHPVAASPGRIAGGRGGHPGGHQFGGRDLAEPTRRPPFGFTEGRCPEGRCPEGRCPEGRCPEGRCPEGRCPEGRCLEGRCPEGRCSEDRCLEGRCPEGRCPEGRCPEGRCPEGRCLEGRCPEGRCPEGRCPEGRCPEGRRPGPHGRRSGDGRGDDRRNGGAGSPRGRTA